MKKFDYTLSHTKKCVINKISQLFDSFGIPYEITKECEDITIFSINYNQEDVENCENSQKLIDDLETLAITYNL